MTSNSSIFFFYFIIMRCKGIATLIQTPKLSSMNHSSINQCFYPPEVHTVDASAA